MFTKRHYEAIAELVGSQLLDVKSTSNQSAIINDWCKMFEDDNPRFKRVNFIKATLEAYAKNKRENNE